MTKSKQRDLLFRVTAEGTLAPDDDFCRQRLRKRQLRVGDVVKADPKKTPKPAPLAPRT